MQLALRCYAGLRGPIGPPSIDAIARSIPGVEPELQGLFEAYRELRRARELYRLTVAFDDHVEPELLEEVAYDLAPLREAGVRTPYRPHLDATMDRTAALIDHLREELSTRV